MDRVFPLRGLRLKPDRRARAARSAAGSHDLDIHRDGTIRLPEIREFEAVVIRH
jgi:hypothetical protein